MRQVTHEAATYAGDSHRTRVRSSGFPGECRPWTAHHQGKGKRGLLLTRRFRRPAKLTVVSGGGKEATITLLSLGDFVGEEAVAAVAGLHMATAVAITGCTALKIQRAEMLRVMHEEHAFSDMFLAFLVSRNMKIQADLLTSFSTPARSGWREYFSSWPSLANPVSRRS